LEEKYPELRGLILGDFLDELRNDDSILGDLLIRLLSKKVSERYARDTLVYRARKDAKELLRDSLERLESWTSLEETVRHASCDSNWIVALACFAAGDAMIRKKARELGIESKRPNNSFRSTGELLDEIQKKMEGHRITLKIFDVYNDEYRNDVIHNGARVDEATAGDILRYTKRLMQALDSESIS
jgi:hypothetical protein